MIQIKRGSLEERILVMLGSGIAEKKNLARELNVKESVLDVSLKKLATAGIAGLDALPDKTFVRILREDYSICGVKPTQKREMVKERKKRKVEKYDGMMFR
jgi:hypothetical protein